MRRAGSRRAMVGPSASGVAPTPPPRLAAMVGVAAPDDNRLRPTTRPGAHPPPFVQATVRASTTGRPRRLPLPSIFSSRFLTAPNTLSFGSHALPGRRRAVQTWTVLAFFGQPYGRRTGLIILAYGWKTNHNRSLLISIVNIHECPKGGTSVSSDPAKIFGHRLNFSFYVLSHTSD